MRTETSTVAWLWRAERSPDWAASLTDRACLSTAVRMALRLMLGGMLEKKEAAGWDGSGGGGERKRGLWLRCVQSWAFLLNGMVLVLRAAAYCRCRSE